MANTVSYVYEIIDRYTKTLAKIAKETRRYDAIVKDLTKHTQVLTKELGRQSRAFREVNKNQNLSKKSLQGFSTGTLTATRRLDEFVSAGKRLDKTTQDVRELKDQITAMRKAATQGAQQLKALSKVRIAGMMPGGGVAPTGRGRARGGGVRGGGLGRFAAGGGVGGLGGAIGTIGITAGLKNMIMASSTMEDAMGDIARVTDMGNKELLAFEEQLGTMSEELVKSKLGLAEMAFEAGKLGVLPENMEEFLRLSAKAAVAFDMMDQETGRVIGSIRAKMGLMGDDTVKLLDSVNFLADNTSASGARMIEVIERLSGTFSILKLPPEVAAGFAGFADQVEVTPQLAASGMRMMIRQMRKMPGMTTKMMEDPIGAVNQQLEIMSKLGPEVQTKYIQKVFGPEAGRFVEKAVSRIDLFRETMKKALSPEAADSMQREFEKKLKLSGRTFELFGFTVTNTMDDIGDILKPSAKGMTENLIEMVKQFREWAKVHPVLIGLGGTILTITAAIGALSISIGILGAIFAPIVGLIAAISFPVWAVIAAVAALTAVSIDAFNNFDNAMDGYGKLFDYLGDRVSNAMDGYVKFFDYLGDEMNNAMEGWGKLFDYLGEKIGFNAEINAPVTSLGKEGASNVAARRNQGAQSVTMGGEIQVSASNGASIDSAEIGLDGGQNLAYSGM